jgi:hypothetical protein
MVQIRLISVFAATVLAWVTSAHITLEDIDSLRSITKDCNANIRALKSSHNGNPAQAVILENENSKDEIEDVSLLYSVVLTIRHLWLIGTRLWLAP